MKKMDELHNLQFLPWGYGGMASLEAQLLDFLTILNKMTITILLPLLRRGQGEARGWLPSSQSSTTSLYTLKVST